MLRGGNNTETTSTMISALQKKIPSLTVSTKKPTSNPPVLQSLTTTTSTTATNAKKQGGISTSSASSASKKPEKEYEKSQLFLADFARLTQDKLI